jgi:hypothetical protein
MFGKASISLACAFLAGCGPDRIVIEETSPYFETTLQLPSRNAERFIRASEQFAEGHRLQISVNRFGGASFSVLMYDAKPAKLNLTAINTIAPDKVTVGAYSTTLPTEAQIQLARAYVAAVVPLTFDALR